MNSNKFIAGVILGAAAGAALTFFLKSEKGQEIMDDVKTAATDATDTIKNKVRGLREELDNLLRKGKQYADDLENQAQDTIS